MNRLFILPLVMLLSGCFLEQNSRQISVKGEAEIEVAPDSFRMSARILSNGSNKDVVLSNLSKQLSNITDKLPMLEGLSSMTVEPSALEIIPVFESECEGRRSYSSDEACPIEGYFAQISLEIEGSPAIEAGNVFSLASELGAEEVDFGEYFLVDPSLAENEAEAKAFENAREKAIRLAASANIILGEPLRITGGGANYTSVISHGLTGDTIVVTGSRLMPRNILSITPPPITVEREVNVTFAIE
jgi:uncharacterized protein YggE